MPLCKTITSSQLSITWKFVIIFALFPEDVRNPVPEPKGYNFSISFLSLIFLANFCFSFSSFLFSSSIFCLSKSSFFFSSARSFFSFSISDGLFLLAILIFKSEHLDANFSGSNLSSLLSSAFLQYSFLVIFFLPYFFYLYNYYLKFLVT